jgi:hypothetical protein
MASMILLSVLIYISERRSILEIDANRPAALPQLKIEATENWTLRNRVSNQGNRQALKTSKMDARHPFGRIDLDAKVGKAACKFAERHLRL